MSPSILATKLFVPPRRPKVVVRPRLIEQLNKGFRRKLTLISAPAGFGKTTLLSEWLGGSALPVAWLSLDKADNDPARFLAYLVAALRTIAPNTGDGILPALLSPQLPPLEPILTALLNEITPHPDHFLLVLDDYHVIDARSVDSALTFLLEHLPPQMHLVLATREDPPLPHGRLRAQEQLTELRAADLRFTPAEAAKFLNQVMGLNLSTPDIAALEARTEGWIAGLQLAALALQGQTTAQGHADTGDFIKSFTGSHRFVVDYLVEQVLQQQSPAVQNFLLCTSILDRMCGPLCDALLRDPSLSGQAVLQSLERANLFIIPLDDERRWYRYHHLFAGLLRQRLRQNPPPLSFPQNDEAEGGGVAELHIRASQWYEDNGLDLEAFQHAAAANDVERAERLMQAKGIPRHYFGGVTPILEWLASLPTTVLDARPWLWIHFAALQLIAGNTTGVEAKLRAGEAALQAAGLVASDGSPVLFPAPPTDNDHSGAAADPRIQHLVGQIASARATLALTRYDVASMLAQSSRALEYLHPDTLPYHTALWTQGFAYFVIGDRRAARQSFTQAITLSQATGDMFTTILATIGLGNVQEADNELRQAAQTYRLVLQWAGEHPQQIVHEAHLGLARVLYEWNDLAAAEKHGEQGLKLAQQYDVRVIDRFILAQLVLARLKLARGDLAGASALLAQTEESARQPNFAHRLPEVAAVQVQALLYKGNVAAAAKLADTFPLPLSRARVYLAQGDADSALEALEPLRRHSEEMDLKDEQLRVAVLQALAHHALDDQANALARIGAALELAETGGNLRVFVDEGAPMAQLLSQVSTPPANLDYLRTLRQAFEDTGEDTQPKTEASPSSSVSDASTKYVGIRPSSLYEPLTSRELEILRLLAQGRSNSEIANQLSLSLNTVKGHNRRIFDKLQVARRTEAVARARELGLL